ASRLLASARVDADEGAAGVRGAQDLRVQHSRPIDVEAVFGAPGGLGWPVEALNLGADHAAIGWRRHGLAPLLVTQGVDRIPHLFVGAATANIALQAFFDLGRRRL